MDTDLNAAPDNRPADNPQVPQVDSLTPGAVEKRELENFLNRGYRTHTVIYLLSFVGLLLFLAAMLYWNTFDYFKDPHSGEWRPYVGEILRFDLKNQAGRDYTTFQPRANVKGPRPAHWPVKMYAKVRFDIYLISGVVLLLALIAIKIEGAKAHRRELLILRALLRENEKLRLHLKEMENTLPSAK